MRGATRPPLQRQTWHARPQMPLVVITPQHRPLRASRTARHAANAPQARLLENGVIRAGSRWAALHRRGAGRAQTPACISLATRIASADAGGSPTGGLAQRHGDAVLHGGCPHDQHRVATTMQRSAARSLPSLRPASPSLHGAPPFRTPYACHTHSHS